MILNKIDITIYMIMLTWNIVEADSAKLMHKYNVTVDFCIINNIKIKKNENR